MSRSTKYILGGLALVGGSLYVYDQQVKQVADKRKVQHDGILSSFSKPSEKQTDLREVGSEKGYKIGEQLENLRSKADKKLDQWEVPEKVNEGISNLEKKRAELAAAVSDKAQDVANYASDHADKHGKQSKYLNEEAHKNDPGFFSKLVNKSNEKVEKVSNDIDQSLDDGKNFVLKLADKYIDGVNELGIKTENAVFGTKKSIEDSVIDTKNKVKNDLEAEKNSWFNWFLSGKSNTEKAKDDAIKQYNQAKKDFEAAKESAVSGGKSWLNWGEKQTKEASEEAQKKLKEAEGKFNSALSNLKGYGQDVLDSVNKKDYQGRLTEEELAQRSYSTLRGWGDSAAIFAEDELETIDSYRKKHPNTYNWADDLWCRTENLSKYAYDRAKENYDNLTNEAEKTKNKGQGWFSSQSKEAEKKADQVGDDLNKKLDEAKVQLDKAQDNFNSWLSKSGKTLADYTETAIDKTKLGLSIGHEETQKGLSEGKEWVNSKK